MFRSIQEVKRANATHGHSWFSAENMRYFGTKIVTGLLQAKGTERQFFITLDQPDHGDDRRYTVREVLPDGKIRTLGDLRDHASQADAMRAIGKVAL